MDDISTEVARRVAAVNGVYVRTPELEDAMLLMDEVRTERRGDGKATCGLVTGESGSGKTLLFERYLRRQPEPIGEDVPVLLLSVPTPFTPVSFMNAFLTALGEPVLSKQDFHAVVPRVHLAMRRRKVELVLLQEVSHIVDQKERTAKIPYYATDIMKEHFLDASYPVPLVMSGVPIATRLVSINPQLTMRMLRHVRLDGFDMSNELSTERFSILLELYEEAAAFPRRHFAGNSALVRRVHAATSGIFGNVARLVRDAIRLGVRRGANGLDVELLAEAHARTCMPEPGWRNPLLFDNPTATERDDTRRTLLHRGRRRAA